MLKSTLRRKILVIFLAVLALGIVGLGLLAVIYLHISASQADKIFTDVAKIPTHNTALILGTSPFVAPGRPNIFFQNRIAAAAEIFKAGKASYILASGDNGSNYYDETSQMRKSLISAGVTAENIYGDYAGFRTLDSVVRAKLVFEQDNFIIVTQKFHLERALYIAQYFKIPAVGFVADDPKSISAKLIIWREALARVKMLIDLFVLDTMPKSLGDPEHIPTN